MNDRPIAGLPALPGGRGLLGRLQEVASRLPGADIAGEALQSLESLALHELKHRLDGLEESTPALPSDSAASLAHRLHPRLILRALLDEATEQNKQQARRSLFTRLLLELTPDEACMLAALSDRNEFALIHIMSGNALTGLHRVAGFFSSIAKQAPIKLREYSPHYVQHLHNLGLAEIGAEDRKLELQYQILEGEPKVQEIVRGLKSRHRSARFQRRVVRATPLAIDLWAFCQEDG